MALKAARHHKILMVMQDGEEMAFNNQRDIARYLGISQDRVKDAVDTGHILDDDALTISFRRGEVISNDKDKVLQVDGMGISSIPVEVIFSNGDVQKYPSKATAARILNISMNKVNRAVRNGVLIDGASFRPVEQ